MSQQPNSDYGKVYLVGAGPGAPGLITLRGVECLHRADVVLYDYLVNPQILRHARDDAERICLGRHGGSRIWTLEQINAKMTELALAGQTVVRLKGGDPAVFARGAEEVKALVERDIPFEIVPGITVALAAGSYAGVPITHREHASAVALVTGQEMSGKPGPKIDYSKLAQFPGTLVIYMGVTTADTWVNALIAGGMSPEMPALIIRRCSFPDQRTIRCTVGQLQEHLTGADKLRPPAIVVIGSVAALPRAANWFERLPLFGQTILVTRPLEQVAGLAEPLAEQGADVLVQPAIEVRAPSDWGPADAVVTELSGFDWVVFSSVNGVDAFMQRLLSNGRDLRALGTTKLAAIGPATVKALGAFHLQVDRVPERYQAEDLAAALSEEAAGKRFLLVRASRGRDVLARQLAAARAEVKQVVFYESVDVTTADAQIAAAMRAGRVRWTTVTSSAIARSLARLFPEDLGKTQLASISPITTATLSELGFTPTVEAREATMSGVVQAILEGVKCAPRS